MSYSISKRMHVCGAMDVEGMNSDNWTSSKFLQFIVQHVPSYEAPYKGDHRVAGYGFYNICVAGSKVKNSLTQQTVASQPMTHLPRMHTFKRFIESRGLGTVTIAPDCYNPHYAEDHVLRPATFTPNNSALIDFAVKREWIKEPKKSVCDFSAHPSWAPGEIKLGLAHANERL